VRRARVDDRRGIRTTITGKIVRLTPPRSPKGLQLTTQTLILRGGNK